MTRWNLKQASLLELSGELSSAARAKLFEYLRRNPVANSEFQSLRENLQLLQSLPIPEPSAAQRRTIPATIKNALQQKFANMAIVGRPRRRLTLIRYALAGSAAIAAAFLVAMLTSGLQPATKAAPEADQFTRISSLVDRLTAPVENPTPYTQALTDVEASIRQLQTESPTLASVHDQEMAKLLDALATVPSDVDTYFEAPSPDSL